jgi:PAS domain-containing protein
VLFSNPAARQILGESLTEAPRPEVVRVFDQALQAPGSEVRMDVLGGVAREPFLARVFGLPGPGRRLVVVHLHTPDFPLVQVARGSSNGGGASAAEVRSAPSAPVPPAALAAAASAVDAFRGSRQQSAAEQRAEQVLMQSMEGGGSGSIDFSPAGLGVSGASFDFLLRGSMGSFAPDELPMPSFEWTAGGDCVMANRAMREVLGCAAAAPLAALGLACVVAPGSRPLVQRMLAEVLGGPESARSGAVTLRKLDGTEFAARLVLTRPADGSCAAGQVLAANVV